MVRTELDSHGHEPASVLHAVEKLQLLLRNRRGIQRGKRDGGGREGAALVVVAEHQEHWLLRELCYKFEHSVLPKKSFLYLLYFVIGRSRADFLVF